MDGRTWLKDIIEVYKTYRDQCERAAAQVSDQDFFATVGNYPSSIGTLLKHLGENNRSRWRDFLTADGEKPDRNREGEFIVDDETRESIMKIWNTGWTIAMDSLYGLTTEDLERSITIRGQALTVPQAIVRNLTHLANHAGQIVLLARHFAGDKWQTLSIARGKTDDFNAAMRAKYGDWLKKDGEASVD